MRFAVFLSALFVSGALPALAMPQPVNTLAKRETLEQEALRVTTTLNQAEAAHDAALNERTLLYSRFEGFRPAPGPSPLQLKREAANQKVAETKAHRLLARHLYVDSRAIGITDKLRVLNSLKVSADYELHYAQSVGAQPQIAIAAQEVQIVNDKIARWSAPGAVP